MNNKLILIPAIILFLLFIFGCSNQSLEKVDIGVYKGEFSSLVLIADENGFFKDNGLDAQLTFYDNGVDPLKKVISKKHDFSTCGEFVAVSHIFDNPNLRIIAEIDTADAIELIVNDPKMISISDIKSKKIGLKKKSQAEYFMGVLLNSNDLKISDIEIVDIAPSVSW